MEVPLVLQEYMIRFRDCVREHRVDWYGLTKSFVQKRGIGSSSHHMDEKKQVRQKKRKMKKQFKKSEEIDVAERKLKLDEDDVDMDEESRIGVD